MQHNSPAFRAAESLLKEFGPIDIYRSGRNAIRSLAPAKKLSGSDGETKKAFVFATIEGAAHFSLNPRSDPENANRWFAGLQCPPYAAIEISRMLLQQKLQISTHELVCMINKSADIEDLSPRTIVFLEPLVDVAEGHAGANGIRADFRSALLKLKESICWNNAPDTRLRNQIGKILATTEGFAQGSAPTANEAPTLVETPQSGFAATASAIPNLQELKEYLGLCTFEERLTSQTGADRFLIETNSDLSYEHELISGLLAEVPARRGNDAVILDRTRTYEARKILNSDPTGTGRLLIATVERVVNAYLTFDTSYSDYQLCSAHQALGTLFDRLIKQRSLLSRPHTFDLLLFSTATELDSVGGFDECILPALHQIEADLQSEALNDWELTVLKRLRCRLVVMPPWGELSARTLNITKLIGDEPFFALIPGEHWSDAINADLKLRSPQVRTRWIELLKHASTATGSRPSPKWLVTARGHIKSIKTGHLTSALLKWLPLVSKMRSVRVLPTPFGMNIDTNSTLIEENADCLRGLLWTAALAPSGNLVRILGDLAISCYRKIPGKGPRAVKVGNAAVFALSQIGSIGAVGQLAILQAKVKFGTALTEIEKAFNLAAAGLNLPREELEEMAVPIYGLTGVGIFEEPMADHIARMTVSASLPPEIVWVKPTGEIQRGVPSGIKISHKGDVKALKAVANDIQKMLPAQRERLDSLFLQQRTWPYATWLERYCSHPLVGILARRLLWQFTTARGTYTGIWFKERLVDLDLRPIADLDSAARVQLWHPIGKSTDEIAAWRGWLEEQQIQQPFKQAHREIYLLTDAEQRTRTYSNRYAAHVLKQHQFSALCALRGWKNKLRLLVDAEYPPAALSLPKWDLRVEFWIEGIGENYGTDTNESGAFLYLSTDQVRFYRLDSRQRTAHAGGGGYQPGCQQLDPDPLSLTQIPPIVFSEVMRDVDMFVGVASVGNDANWSDGGPEGRHHDYWQTYSFGDLTVSAKTRKAVLERIIPKLKIAARCSFDDKFLLVRGTLRSYRIHLGSGNILMSPNDQYLCIVPKQGTAVDGKVFLPFEGDRTLSLIISKALLLAEDAKIADESITGQLKRV